MDDCTRIKIEEQFKEFLKGYDSILLDLIGDFPCGMSEESLHHELFKVFISGWQAKVEGKIFTKEDMISYKHFAVAMALIGKPNDIFDWVIDKMIKEKLKK